MGESPPRHAPYVALLSPVSLLHVHLSNPRSYNMHFITTRHKTDFRPLFLVGQGVFLEASANPLETLSAD